MNINTGLIGKQTLSIAVQTDCIAVLDAAICPMKLLNTAYTIYQKIQDCNVAYNDTLDCVIDRVEEMIEEDHLDSMYK